MKLNFETPEGLPSLRVCREHGLFLCLRELLIMFPDLQTPFTLELTFAQPVEDGWIEVYAHRITMRYMTSRGPVGFNSKQLSILDNLYHLQTGNNHPPEAFWVRMIL